MSTEIYAAFVADLRDSALATIYTDRELHGGTAEELAAENRREIGLSLAACQHLSHSVHCGRKTSAAVYRTYRHVLMIKS